MTWCPKFCPKKFANWLKQKLYGEQTCFCSKIKGIKPLWFPQRTCQYFPSPKSVFHCGYSTLSSCCYNLLLHADGSLLVIGKIIFSKSSNWTWESHRFFFSFPTFPSFPLKFYVEITRDLINRKKSSWLSCEPPNFKSLCR